MKAVKRSKSGIRLFVMLSFDILVRLWWYVVACYARRCDKRRYFLFPYFSGFNVLCLEFGLKKRLLIDSLKIIFFSIKPFTIRFVKKTLLLLLI